MSVEEIARGLRARKSGSGWMAICPAHEDKTPSLHVNERNGRVLVHCHAGCSQAAVIHKLSEMGLWETKAISPAERERRLLARYYQEQIRKRNQARADAYDEIKLEALESEDWELWERVCRQQYRFAKAAGR